MSEQEHAIFLPIEHEAIHLLLAGDLHVLKLLREQAQNIVAIDRESTAMGFFANFQFDENVKPIPHLPDFVLGDVCGQVEGTQHGAMFLLFIKAGKLGFLECTTFGDDQWPQPLKGFSLGYAKGERDWAGLKKSIPEV